MNHSKQQNESLGCHCEKMRSALHKSSLKFGNISVMVKRGFAEVSNMGLQSKSYVKVG